MKSVKGKEIVFTTENKVGMLEEISKLIKDEGVDIKGVSAWGEGDKAFFRLLTSDNSKTKGVLQRLGNIEEKDVVIVDMPDEIGQLQMLSSKLKDVGIDLNYIYGTTSEPGKTAIIVFSSNDNDKALEVISA